MKILLTILLWALLIAPAWAGSTFDPQSGNTYEFYPNSSGTTVFGNNPRTGSNWHTFIEPDGDMNGTDSKGRYWRYDSQTGDYSRSDKGILPDSDCVAFCD
jgi:hypothetical protein